MNKRILLGHSTEPDPDGQKHEWLQYKYNDYIINKEWYMNSENEYVMGIAIFKKNEENNEYYEMLHSCNAHDLPDDELIDLAEKIRNRVDL